MYSLRVVERKVVRHLFVEQFGERDLVANRWQWVC